ncbi:MAG: NnrS family protein [Deltaproteobacteria bacterium]|nr:NnrS family protein [Deltaproteobacteria bacterium]NND27616.1 NnrS family protein [Myxococcales bacterium]MBT8463255.1 NnrS family protein [Deltaproteobacteria bacterium]MBT8480483.1 NnrS family protein [Deltaproteobacteria bacterium]NNK06252.1 NnrS family protein [Myxococcales bacterium]
MTVFLSYAFRPLFLLATVYAIVVVPLWAGAWLGYLPFPATLGTPIGWHAHEMTFGFAGAAVGGFALTAVATWTGRPPVSGAPLFILSGLWLIARITFFLPFPSLLAPAVVADLGYGGLLFALMSREVISVGNERNYKVLLILGLLLVSNAIFFLGIIRSASWTMTALHCGVWLIVLLVNLIAGRIIPGFTRNWLKRRDAGEMHRPKKLPPTFDRFDRISTGLLVAFAIFQLLDAPPRETALLGAVTSASLFVRVARWQGIQSSEEPLVWVLHVAYLWLPVAILLLCFAEVGLVPQTSGIHALSSGAITTMIVAVASRAALGHTGRPLESHPVLTASYALITVAAICRVAATFGPAARVLLAASATAWCLGFICFAWRYVPILTQPKVQRQGSLPTV